MIINIKLIDTTPVTALSAKTNICHSSNKHLGHMATMQSAAPTASLQRCLTTIPSNDLHMRSILYIIVPSLWQVLTYHLRHLSFAVLRWSLHNPSSYLVVLASMYFTPLVSWTAVGTTTCLRWVMIPLTWLPPSPPLTSSSLRSLLVRMHLFL